jgi:glucokinase
MAARFGVPTFVENNVRSMALAELWCGQGRGLRNLICLGIRSGIGSGIVVEGQLLRGANNVAGEIGRWSWPPADARSRRTASSPPQTIEDVASLTAILAKAANTPGEVHSVAQLLGALASEDRLTLRLCDEAANVHGWIVHQLSELFDPQRIILAGPLVESDRYLAAVQQAASRLGGPETAERVVRSTLGEFAGAIGAAALVFNHWRPRR